MATGMYSRHILRTVDMCDPSPEMASIIAHIIAVIRNNERVNQRRSTEEHGLFVRRQGRMRHQGTDSHHIILAIDSSIMWQSSRKSAQEEEKSRKANSKPLTVSKFAIRKARTRVKTLPASKIKISSIKENKRARSPEKRAKEKEEPQQEKEPIEKRKISGSKQNSQVGTAIGHNLKGRPSSSSSQ